jgi:hypothetical protein
MHPLHDVGGAHLGFLKILRDRRELTCEREEARDKDESAKLPGAVKTRGPRKPEPAGPFRL